MKVEMDVSDLERFGINGITMEQMGDYYGISKQRVSQIFDECPELKIAYNRGVALGADKATASLMNLVEKGNVVATLFYLKSRAGWVEKQHVKGVKSTEDEIKRVHIYLPDNDRGGEVEEKFNPSIISDNAGLVAR